MAKTKLQTQAEVDRRNKIKREKERERRLKIREDPVKREIQRQKDRAKYLKQKEKGIKKSILDLTPREQRVQRKKWRQNSKNYRTSKKSTTEFRKRMEENSPPQSDSEQHEIINHNQELHRKEKLDRKQANMVKVLRYREKKKIKMKYEEKIIKLKNKLAKFRMRYYREVSKRNNEQEEKKSPLLSPNKRVDHYLDVIRSDPKKIDVVKKRLVLGEVMKDQLSESYQNIKSHESKSFFKEIVNGRIVKRKKLSSDFQKLFKYRTHYVPRRFHRKHLNNLKKKIEQFLEDDACSRQCPGRKDFVTKNKDQHQKRFLMDTLKNLYLKFKKKHPNVSISYSFFCRWKPYWIVQMKIQDRDTCKCLIHANMDLFTQGLQEKGIVFQKTPTDMMMSICCGQIKEGCLFRDCETCRHKKIEYTIHNINESFGYQQWVYVKQTYLDKKTKTAKLSTKVGKKFVEQSVGDAILLFENKFKLFLAHEARIQHQYKEMAQLKLNLKSREILVHCDFSENYNLKYAEETQAFHFGGSRQQISMHTVIVYSQSEFLTTKSYCSLSDSLQHDAGAIWAHLFPILKEYVGRNPDLDTFHFFSDSPATQYRNKKMFYFIAVCIKQFFSKIQHVTWNYQEAGHGKGAPDGIGGVCKRTADRVVSQGKDIANLDTLVDVLVENCPGVQILKIGVDEIEKMTDLIQKGETKAFSGTLKVHQVKTNVDTGILYMRQLSCFECYAQCNHYNLGTLNFKEQVISQIQNNIGYLSSSDEDDDLDSTIPSNVFKPRTEHYYNKVYSDDESVQDFQEVSFVSNEGTSRENVVCGTYLLVKLDNPDKKKHLAYKYVAVCQGNMDHLGEVKVAFLKLCNAFNNKENEEQIFRLNENDVSYISENQILQVLPLPQILFRGKRVFYKFKNAIDVYEKA